MNSSLRHTMNRREFLRSGAAGIVALDGATSLRAAEPDPPPAMDTHTHFYDPKRPQGVPWPGKNDKLLYRTVLPAEFKELTRKFNVRSTIVVEASPWVEDNQWLLDLAAKEPFIAGIVGHLDPGGDDFAKNFERFARDPLFRGIRVNHTELRKGLEQKKYLDHLNLLAKQDRELDVNGGPDMPADVARLTKLLPELRIVINHEANVTIDGKPAPKAWRDGLSAAAEGKHVFCKVSALVEGTRRNKGDAPDDVEFYRPVLDALWEVFGADRLIYGSNWPVSESAAPYSRAHQIVLTYFQKRGAGAVEKYLMRNALAAYKPPERK